jgi:hypothetical protein
MTVGGVVGAMFAGGKLDEDLRRSVAAYALAVDAWYEAGLERYNATMPAASAQDDEARTARASGAAQPLGLAGRMVLASLVFGVVAVVGGIGYGAHRAYAWLTTSPPVPLERPAEVDAGLAADPGPALVIWTCENGSRYRLERRGREIVFVVADTASTRGRYRPDETEFVLTPDDDGAFGVTHTVRPQPPRGSAYDDSAYADCARAITVVDGAPLRARRTSSGFEIESAVVELSPRDFVRGEHRSRIAGCTNLGAATIFRRTLRFAPL